MKKIKKIKLLKVGYQNYYRINIILYFVDY